MTASEPRSLQANWGFVRNLLVAVPFGLVFAYDVFESTGNLVLMIGYANDLRLAIVSWGWAVLFGAILLPAALWVGASWAGWKRPVRDKLVVQLLALAVSATSYLSIITVFNDTTLLVLPTS